VPSPSASVELSTGRIRGRDGAYLGIPYAAPPVTERRWHEPELVGRWAGELDVLAVGPPPPQPVRPISEFAWGAIPPGREDCLYLNVWTPSSGAGDWPVLVWSIGGGWTIGWTGSGVDHGARLAYAAEVVVVTFSYRPGSIIPHRIHASARSTRSMCHSCSGRTRRARWRCTTWLTTTPRGRFPRRCSATGVASSTVSPSTGARRNRTSSVVDQASAPSRIRSSAPPPKFLSCSIAIRMIG
jgi:hypothetical protein